MEKHKLTEALNLHSRIIATKNILKYIYESKGKFSIIEIPDCPCFIPIPTKSLQEKMYMLIKTYYEDELNKLENQLKELKKSIKSQFKGVIQNEKD